MDNTVIDINSDKYKVLLKFVNNILANIGKSKINNLNEFIDIDREDIIKDVNIKMLKNMEDEIFKYYNKHKCGYYRKSDTYVLNCLRGMLKQMNIEISYKQREKSEYINNVSFKRTHTLYSIK